MIKEIAQAVVGANKIAQAGKTVKRGVKSVERGMQRSTPRPQPRNAKQPVFKNVRTPSNTPGGMKGWNQTATPRTTPPGTAVTIRKTKAHPEGVRRVVQAPKRPTTPKKK